MIFKGSGVAIITPFDDNNNINYNKLRELIKYHIQNQTDAIIVCGTTGESATLSNDEKKELIKFTVTTANKKIPVIAGTGSNNTMNAIEMTKYAKSVGADGALVVTPYYNKCTQDGLYYHYKRIADETDIPIILYNVPSRTGVDISIDSIIKLSKINNIIGIKEACPNLSKIANIISSTDNNFSVYSGNDDLLLPILALGGKGVISVAANIIPNEIHQICEYYFNNDYYKSKEIFYNYLKFIQKLFIEVNPIPIKYVMNKLGYNVGNLRLPLNEISENNKLKLNNEITKLDFKLYSN